MRKLMTGLVMVLVPNVLMAGQIHGFSIVPYVGFSAIGDQAPRSVGLGTLDGGVDVALDPGFTGGLSLRYDYGSDWSSEFGWEYRSHDSELVDAGGNRLPSGNYASNVFYINGRYSLPMSWGRFKPYVGGGITWIQEIDLDSENAATERSFSDSGSVGYQLMLGSNIDLSDRWYLTSELRYSDQRSLTLSEENGSATIQDIDYQPITLQLGIGYRF